MDNRPPLSSQNSSSSHNEPYGDPFADRPRALQFSEPQPQPYDSTVSLQQDRSGNYSDEDFTEKLPLTSGQNFSGGFYPPGCVALHSCCSFDTSHTTTTGLLTPMSSETPTDRAPCRPCRPSRVVSTPLGVVGKPSSVVSPRRSSLRTVTSSQSTPCPPRCTALSNPNGPPV